MCLLLKATKTNFKQILLVLMFLKAINGAIAQLGERLHGMQEVRGSIPWLHH